MNNFIYIILDFEDKPQEHLAQYLDSCGRCVYFVCKKLFNPKGSNIKYIHLYSNSIKCKAFIQEFINILDKCIAIESKYICILPSTSYPLSSITQFEKFILNSEHEYANIINSKFDSNRSRYVSMFNEFYIPIKNEFIKKTITKFFNYIKLKRSIPFGFMLHYGTPYGFFTKQTIENMIMNYKDKNFKRIFSMLRHPAFYLLPSLIYKSITGKDIHDLNEIVISTHIFIDKSACFYNDHNSLLIKSKGYFVAKISNYANFLIQELNNNFDKKIEKKDMDFIKIYNSKMNIFGKTALYRIPGYFPSSLLQDLYYNNNKYNVIITDVKIDLKSYFDSNAYSMYGFLFDKNRIDYGNMPCHPCYGDKIPLRNYKFHNFLYDILKTSTKEVIFMINSNSNQDWLNVLANDPNAKFFAYIKPNYLNFINLTIQCTSQKFSCYYKFDGNFNSKSIYQSNVLDHNYDYLQKFIRTINNIMYTKKKIIPFLANSKF